MHNNKNWPFPDERTVMGMPLSEYLEWASSENGYPKKLLLPPIQRGFVWKPVQIAQLWDSLLRGMPIGSLMVSHLAQGAKATDIINTDRKIVDLDADAIGLLDGQQRTLVMLLGWGTAQQSNYCVWVDLGEEGQDGSPVELRISSKTQPFGYQRHSHVKMSRHDRREARKHYDNNFEEHIKVLSGGNFKF